MYSTSAIDGLNHSDKNTPVSSKITKLHSAISPSMNDQWSGKTLRSCFFSRPTESDPLVEPADSAGALRGRCIAVGVLVVVASLITDAPVPSSLVRRVRGSRSCATT